MSECKLDSTSEKPFDKKLSSSLNNMHQPNPCSRSNPEFIAQEKKQIPSYTGAEELIEEMKHSGPVEDPMEQYK